MARSVPSRDRYRAGDRRVTAGGGTGDEQSSGTGRELLERAFQAGGVRHRTLLATFDVRAVARCLRSGLDRRLPIFSVNRAPEPVAVASNLGAEPLATDPCDLARDVELGRLDRYVSFSRAFLA